MRGALPGPGNIQSIPALTQLEHGFSLLHRTFRRRHVTQDLGLRCEFDIEEVRAGSVGVAAAEFASPLTLFVGDGSGLEEGRWSVIM